MSAMEKLTAGRKDHRLEAMITDTLHAAITRRAAELAGDDDPRNFRSSAVRDLLARGIISRLGPTAFDT